MQLTNNFTFEELTDSELYPNLVPANRERALKEPYISNLKYISSSLLQPIREKYGKPINVNSGIRSPALNKAIGGSSTSDHLKGLAADLDSDDNVRLGEMIVSMMKRGELEFGQLIFEKTRKRGTSEGWIHVSLPTSTNYGEVLVFDGNTYTMTERIPKK